MPRRTPRRPMTGRRSVLRAMAVGTAGATAGCAFPSTPKPAVPAPPPYARWLPLPDVGDYVEGVDAETPRRVLVRAARPARIAGRTDALLTAAGKRWIRDDLVDAYLARHDLGLVAAADVDRWVGVRSMVPPRAPTAAVTVRGAMAGTFDAAAARRRLLAEDGTSPAGTYRGYDLVRWTDRHAAAAFGRGRVLRASASPEDPWPVTRPVADLLRATVDVAAGERRPAHERDRDLARLLGHVGDGLAVRATRPPGSEFADVDGLVGWGAASVSVEGLRQRWAGTFDGPPPGDALARRLRAGYFISLADLERRGQAAVARGRVDLPVWLA